MCLAVPSAAAPPRHAVIPFSNPPPPPKKKGDEESRAAILGKRHKCAQDRRIWGLAAVPASCRLLHPHANTPRPSVALCSAGVILAGRTLGGGGGMGMGISHPIISPAISAPLPSHGCSHPFAPIHSPRLCIPPRHPSIGSLCCSEQIHAPICLARTYPPAGTR